MPRSRRRKTSRPNVFIPYYMRRSLNSLEIKHAVSESALGRKAYQRMLEFRRLYKQEAQEHVTAQKYAFDGRIFPELFAAPVAREKVVAEAVDVDEGDVFVELGYMRKAK